MSERVSASGVWVKTKPSYCAGLIAALLAWCSLCSSVHAAQLPIIEDIEFAPSDTPLTTEAVTLSADAKSPDNLPLKISWNFGDGSESATGAVVQHTFTAAGDYLITLSVSDGVNAVVTKTAHLQAIAPPVGGTPGVNQGETQQDPDNGVSSTVLSSINGVVELQIATAGTNPVEVTTDFGDGGRIVNGANPRHAYTSPGIYIATSTVTDQSSGSPVGMIRKTLVISSSDVPSVPQDASVANSGPALTGPSIRRITVTALSGKFNLGTTSKFDSVTATFVVELPSGLPLLQSHDLALSIGNVAETITVNRKGNGQGAQQYKKVKVVWPSSPTNTTLPGQSATITVQMMAADLVAAGFDTEGVSNIAKRVPPAIQFGMLLEGVAWSGSAHATLKVSKRGDVATLSTK